MLSDTDTRALGDALRSEYAAIFGYGVVSAYISGARNSSIAEVWSAHRSRRNRIIHLIESSGEKTPLPELAYTSQDKVWDNLTAIQLAARIEDDCSVAWSRALQQCTTPECRKLAMQALLHTAEWTTRWRMAAGTSPAIDPLPGLRRPDDKRVKEVDPGAAPSPTTPTSPSTSSTETADSTLSTPATNDNMSRLYYNDQYSSTVPYPTDATSSSYSETSEPTTGDYNATSR